MYVQQTSTFKQLYNFVENESLCMYMNYKGTFDYMNGVYSDACMYTVYIYIYVYGGRSIT